jgi:C1A family cysteine protease
MIGKFGFRPGTKQEYRDFRFSQAVPKVMPKRSSVEKFCSPVEDQCNYGSCVFNSVVALYEYNMRKHGKPLKDMSRFFPYYNVRADYVKSGEIDSISEDCGAEIKDAIKSVAALGTCTEMRWPYTPSNFAKKPSVVCYTEAETYQIRRYETINGLAEMKACISYTREPFTFGFWVYESFNDIGEDGIMPMPKSFEECLGGHAVVAVAYDDVKKLFKIRNSWGLNWGDAGYFYMPYDFIASEECMDFWRITSGEQI